MSSAKWRPFCRGLNVLTSFSRTNLDNNVGKDNFAGEYLQLIWLWWHSCVCLLLNVSALLLRWVVTNCWWEVNKMTSTFYIGENKLAIYMLIRNLCNNKKSVCRPKSAHLHLITDGQPKWKSMYIALAWTICRCHQGRLHKDYILSMFRHWFF